jgi:hypothetical protein
MNRLTLKIIAITTMLLDHIALIFFASDGWLYFVFRGLGRIAFVLFAYLLAEGFHHTKSIKNYLLRIGITTLIIELGLLGYYFISKENMLLNFNIFWTLLFGLFGLYLIGRKEVYLRILVIPLIIVAELLQFSYGAYGVLMIVLFGLYQNRLTSFFHLIFLNLLFIDWPLFELFNISEMAKYPYLQWFSILAFIPIFLYNKQLGKYQLKWFFYLFYPAHLLILFFISDFL